LVCPDGGIFTSATRASTDDRGRHLNQPIVGMAATPSGRGYWLVAADGGIFTFGNARFYGSTGGRHLNRPIVGMRPRPRPGHWLVATDGGIFTSATRASMDRPEAPLNQPLSYGVNARRKGYWLVAGDGGIFTFGNARYRGAAT